MGPVKSWQPSDLIEKGAKSHFDHFGEK